MVLYSVIGRDFLPRVQSNIGEQQRTATNAVLSLPCTMLISLSDPQRRAAVTYHPLHYFCVLLGPGPILLLLRYFSNDSLSTHVHNHGFDPFINLFSGLCTW